MTAFTNVATVNEAFGNPKGQPVITGRLINQIRNIAGDGSNGLQGEVKELYTAIEKNDLEGVRDALCDIMVFALGAQHFLGVDGDLDMKAVTNSLFSRLCQDQVDLDATVAKYRALGIQVYTEGAFPRVAVKVAQTVIAEDGEEYVKGKFLKSVSYTKPVFPPVLDEAPSGLYGSSVQPAHVKIGGKLVQLGDAVRAAKLKSGLLSSEWNALASETRERLIAAEIDA